MKLFTKNILTSLCLALAAVSVQAAEPSITCKMDGNNLVITYTGTLLQSSDAVNWTEVASASSPYSITLKDKNENGDPVKGTFKLKQMAPTAGTASDLVFGDDGVQTITIKGNEQWRIFGLPEGTWYKIEESAPTGWTLVSIAPDSGTIDFEGLRPTDITMTSQRPYLMHASVYDNIIYPLKLRGVRIDRNEIDRLLERTGLLEQKQQYAGSLSSGERQKLSFLRAIVFHPSLIMIDETLSNLDPDSESVFRELILERRAEDKSTWLIVTHQQDRLNSIFDTTHYMEKGTVIR